MATLSPADRQALWKQFMVDNKETFAAVTKADIQAFINAVDDWADSNAASYNAALPQPARGQLTSKQKALGLTMVIKRRWELS